MSPKFIFVVVGAGALVFACGPRHGQSDASAHITVRKAVSAKPKNDRVSLSATLAIDAKSDVAFTMRVENDGAKRVELSFPTARTHDFIVLDSLDREVWRWSAGRLFTQSMQNKTLDASDAMSFVGKWTPPAQGGTFTAVAVLSSSNHPLQQRAQFVVAPVEISTASR